MQRLGKKLSRRFRETAADIVSVTGMKEWTCGDLERTVDVAGRPGYVALVDEGPSVGVRVFEDELRAEEAHRRGCLRFMRLRQTDQLNHLRKKFPLKLEGKLSLHMLGRDPVHQCGRPGGRLRGDRHGPPPPAHGGTIRRCGNEPAPEPL